MNGNMYEIVIEDKVRFHYIDFFYFIFFFKQKTAYEI